MLAAAGIVYACVPETDQMDEVATVLVVVGIVELLARRSLGVVAGVPQVALVLWSGLYGATGRASAVVGAWFALWPIVLVGIMIGLDRIVESRRFNIGAVDRFLVAAVGVVAAFTVARTGALQSTVQPAIVAVAIAVPTSLAAAVAIGFAGCTRRIPGADGTLAPCRSGGW